MADGRHLEKSKNGHTLFLCNAFTGLQKIWHGDANWPSEGYGQLKFLTFKNLRWRTAAMKNQKTATCRQQFDR